MARQNFPNFDHLLAGPGRVDSGNRGEVVPFDATIRRPAPGQANLAGQQQVTKNFSNFVLGPKAPMCGMLFSLRVLRDDFSIAIFLSPK
jgi:hypothetical protein